MKHVGFITSAQFPHLTDSDSLLIKPLKKRGIEVVPIIWSSPTHSLSSLDALIMRSTWDYHTHISAFKLFLHSVKESLIPVYNPIDTMLWNMDKSYLLQLKKRGISTIPTIKIHTLNQHILQKIKQWPEIILKPIIGASAYGITKLKTVNGSTLQNKINELLQTSDVLIQPFMKEVYEGEISFIFFDKQFSHAVSKTPKKNDFRTQKFFGASIIRIYPSVHLIHQACDIIYTIKEPLLYARLDAILVKGSLILMELELIEPHLFFDIVPEAASTFADAIARNI